MCICVRARVRVCVLLCVFTSLEGGMPPTGNGNILLSREKERRWRGRKESGYERVLLVVGPQGGTESDKSAGGSQSVVDFMCVTFAKISYATMRRSPFLRLTLCFYITHQLFLETKRNARNARMAIINVSAMQSVTLRCN